MKKYLGTRYKIYNHKNVSRYKVQETILFINVKRNKIQGTIVSKIVPIPGCIKYYAILSNSKFA